MRRTWSLTIEGGADNWDPVRGVLNICRSLTEGTYVALPQPDGGLLLEGTAEDTLVDEPNDGVDRPMRRFIFGLDDERNPGVTK